MPLLGALNQACHMRRERRNGGLGLQVVPLCARSFSLLRSSKTALYAYEPTRGSQLRTHSLFNESRLPLGVGSMYLAAAVKAAADGQVVHRWTLFPRRLSNSLVLGFCLKGCT